MPRHVGTLALFFLGTLTISHLLLIVAGIGWITVGLGVSDARADAVAGTIFGAAALWQAFWIMSGAPD